MARTVLMCLFTEIINLTDSGPCVLIHYKNCFISEVASLIS